MEGVFPLFFKHLLSKITEEERNLFNDNGFKTKFEKQHNYEVVVDNFYFFANIFYEDINSLDNNTYENLCTNYQTTGGNKNGTELTLNITAFEPNEQQKPNHNHTLDLGSEMFMVDNNNKVENNL